MANWNNYSYFDNCVALCVPRDLIPGIRNCMVNLPNLTSLVRSITSESINATANVTVTLTLILTRKGQESFELTKTKTKTESETETKEQKQISIDLDTIFNPNPKLVQTYKDANAMDYWVDKDIRPKYINDARVFAAASKKPVKHNIFSLCRKQIGSKEYCYFLDLYILHLFVNEFVAAIASLNL